MTLGVLGNGSLKFEEVGYIFSERYASIWYVIGFKK